MSPNDQKSAIAREADGLRNYRKRASTLIRSASRCMDRCRTIRRQNFVTRRRKVGIICPCPQLRRSHTLTYSCSMRTDANLPSRLPDSLPALFIRGTEDRTCLFLEISLWAQLTLIPVRRIHSLLASRPCTSDQEFCPFPPGDQYSRRWPLADG